MLVWLFSELGKHIARLYPMPHQVPRFWASIKTAVGMGADFLISELRQSAAYELGVSLDS